MRTLAVAVLIAGGAIPGVAAADPIVCNEPWQTPSHPPVHPGPCHTGGTGTGPGNGPPPGGPAGRKCAFNSTTDSTREAGWQIGQISAGPLVTVEGGTLVCAVHVNNNTHDGPAVATESFYSVQGVAAGEPRVVSYPATAADTVSLCTTWHGTSGTLYWQGGAQPNLGAWSTNPGSCGESLSIEPNYPTCSIWLAIDQRAGTNIAEIWQDCEPYEPII